MVRRFRRNDEAVTEVIGYVLSFALSAVFLLISLNVFHAARANTEDVVTGVELKTIADRIAGKVVEMGLVSQEFENATMNLTIIIPQSLGGRLYTVHASLSGDEIVVVTNDGLLAANATTFRTEALGVPITSGPTGVDSSNERVVVQYLPRPAPKIQIRGE